MLISLIMQIAQSMQISIRYFLNPQTMHITFPLKNLAVKNISGLTHCRYSSGKWTNSDNLNNGDGGVCMCVGVCTRSRGCMCACVRACVRA